MAFACRHFGVRGTIYMPVTTPQQKIDKTKLFGGEFVEIRLVGDFFDDCNRAALEFTELGIHRDDGCVLELRKVGEDLGVD